MLDKRLEPVREWMNRRRRGQAFDVAYHTGKDIELERRRQALASTARYVDEHMSGIRGIRAGTLQEAFRAVLRDALAYAPKAGLVVEFGVATGFTLTEITAHRTPAYGFDSFQGLPEDWYTFRAGTFAQEPPDVPGAELVIGWFEESLPTFLEQHSEPFAFVHMDADLYSSTKTVFDLAFDRFVPGTVITFDEFFNYPGWEHHERKAFDEFIEAYGGNFEFLNYNAMHEQVSVRLT